MNQIDDIAHVIQLSVAPVFLLAGVGALLTVLSGRLARIVDRARVLEQQLVIGDRPPSATIVNELNVLERRGRLIYHAIKLSTISALLVCLVIVVLFASSILHYSIRLVVSALFIAMMLTSIASLLLFLREVYLAIWTFEVGFSFATKEEATDHRMQTAHAGK